MSLCAITQIFLDYMLFMQEWVGNLPSQHLPNHQLLPSVPCLLPRGTAEILIWWDNVDWIQRLMREASIRSRKAGEKYVSPNSVRKVTEVRCQLNRFIVLYWWLNLPLPPRKHYENSRADQSNRLPTNSIQYRVHAIPTMGMRLLSDLAYKETTWDQLPLLLLFWIFCKGKEYRRCCCVGSYDTRVVPCGLSSTNRYMMVPSEQLHSRFMKEQL